MIMHGSVIRTTFQVTTETYEINMTNLRVKLMLGSKSYHITNFVSILYTYTVINNYILFLQSLNRYY
jgi:YbbR domain-containing protein